MKKITLLIIIIIGLYGFNSIHNVNQVRWLAPASAKKISNPVSVNKRASSAKKGAKLFSKNCVVCHGQVGKGDGIGGKALNPKPANLTSKLVQNQVDGEIFWKITNGNGPMIKWGPIIPEKDRWDLVNFIRTLKN
jgi:mono/diheme cytochrome c family protein